MELSPSAQIRAHRRTARIMTTLASKLLPVEPLESGRYWTYLELETDAPIADWLGPGSCLWSGVWRSALLLEKISASPLKELERAAAVWRVGERDLGIVAANW